MTQIGTFSRCCRHTSATSAHPRLRLDLSLECAESAFYGDDMGAAGDAIDGIDDRRLAAADFSRALVSGASWPLRSAPERSPSGAPPARPGPDQRQHRPTHAGDSQALRARDLLRVAVCPPLRMQVSAGGLAGSLHGSDCPPPLGRATRRSDRSDHASLVRAHGDNAGPGSHGGDLRLVGRGVKLDPPGRRTGLPSADQMAASSFDFARTLHLSARRAHAPAPGRPPAHWRPACAQARSVA